MMESGKKGKSRRGHCHRCGQESLLRPYVPPYMIGIKWGCRRCRGYEYGNMKDHFIRQRSMNQLRQHLKKEKADLARQKRELAGKTARDAWLEDVVQHTEKTVRQTDGLIDELEALYR